MNEKGENHDRHDQIDAIFESVFKGVEARRQPPVDISRDVYFQFEKQWKERRATIKRRKKMTYLAMAASVLMVLLLQPLFFNSQNAPIQPAVLGTIVKSIGDVTVSSVHGRFKIEGAAPPSALSKDQSLVTASGAGLAIQWGGTTTQLRLDQNTELRLNSDCEVELAFGRLYVDVPPALANGSVDCTLQVVTRFAIVRHLGTQFVVSTNDEAAQVWVREGRVAIDSGNQSQTVSFGVKGIFGSSGIIRSEPIQTYGPSWYWVEKLVPLYKVDGQTLSEFVSWIHRQTGKKTVYESAAAESIAKSTVLHGTQIEMEPMRALALILQTSDLTWTEVDGTIHFSIQR